MSKFSSFNKFSSGIKVNKRQVNKMYRYKVLVKEVSHMLQYPNLQLTCEEQLEIMFGKHPGYKPIRCNACGNLLDLLITNQSYTLQYPLCYTMGLNNNYLPEVTFKFVCYECNKNVHCLSYTATYLAEEKTWLIDKMFLKRELKLNCKSR